MKEFVLIFPIVYKVGIVSLLTQSHEYLQNYKYLNLISSTGNTFKSLQPRFDANSSSLLVFII
jgi:hypothetical protein